VHLLHIHGTADGTLPYGGSPGLLGAVQSVETWAAMQGCSTTPDASDAPFDFYFLTPGAETQPVRYEDGCAAGGSATLWSQVGTGHVPFPTSTGKQRLVAFLEAHPRPAQGAGFCAGVAGACPCGNTGLPGHGCDNAAQTGGVVLALAGGAGGGSATLVGTGFPAGAAPAVVVIRSTARTAGTPFGDGLRCLAAPIVRVASGTAGGGTSTHALTHGAGPGTFHYQLWYRSTPAAYCDAASAFNLSNGLSIAWP
jgi:hypothetical protein